MLCCAAAASRLRCTAPPAASRLPPTLGALNAAATPVCLFCFNSLFGPLRPELPPEVPLGLRKLLRADYDCGCWCADPLKRPTAQQLVEQLDLELDETEVRC